MQEKVASLVRYLRGLAVRRPVAPPRTLLQPRDAHQCVRLVQAFARSDDTDTLTTRLVSAYHSFPPSEADMRHLSLLQQEWQDCSTPPDWQPASPAARERRTALCCLPTDR